MKRVAGICVVVTYFIVLSACMNQQRYLAKGNKLFDEGKYAEAVINYRKAIQKDPKFGEAYYRLGLAALKQRDGRQAYQELSRAVNAFIAAGGNVSIENYGGGTYDGVVPGGANPADSVEGIGAQGATFAHPESGCTDGERVTADGIAKGFTQPGIDGCWSHQGYETSYWSTFGYESLMASATDATDLASSGSGLGFTFADGTQLGSSFLALGGSLGAPGVPEPSMTLLLGGALAAVVALRKRFAAR